MCKCSQIIINICNKVNTLQKKKNYMYERVVKDSYVTLQYITRARYGTELLRLIVRRSCALARYYICIFSLLRSLRQILATLALSQSACIFSFRFAPGRELTRACMRACVCICIWSAGDGERTYVQCIIKYTCIQEYVCIIAYNVFSPCVFFFSCGSNTSSRIVYVYINPHVYNLLRRLLSCGRSFFLSVIIVAKYYRLYVACVS